MLGKKLPEARDVTGPEGIPVIGSNHALGKNYKTEDVGQKEETLDKRKRAEEVVKSVAVSGDVGDGRVGEVFGLESVAASTSLVVVEELVERFRDKYDCKEREELDMIVKHKVSFMYLLYQCTVYHVLCTIYHVPCCTMCTACVQHVEES